MIPPAAIVWGFLFFVVIIAVRIVLDRARRTATTPKLGLTLTLIALSFAPAAFMIRAVLAQAAEQRHSHGTAMAVALVVVVIMVIAGIVIGPFIAEMGGFFGAWMILGAPSERAMKARKSYDRAKAFVHKQEFDAAVAEYRAELAKDPAQAHGFRELADVLEKLGRDDEAIVELERALPLTEDVEERALTRLRVVDLHARRGRMDRARDLLAQMESESWPQRIAKAIQTRRQRLSP